MVTTFSAVIATKNEEERIGRLLETVSWCDEVIVVDDYSTDKTRDIARKCGAKVIKKRKGTLAEQWRFALSKASKDWIIWAGADQWLSQELIQDIRRRVGKEKFVGYKVTMQEYFFGVPLRVKDISIYRAMWVVKRKAMIVPEVRVHQYLKVKGKVGVLDGVMGHDTFRSFDQIISKFNYYTTLQAREAHEQGMRTSLVRIFMAPIYLFFWRMVKLKEYKDGVLGFFLALVMALDKLFFHLKLWELEFKEKKKR